MGTPTGEQPLVSRSMMMMHFAEKFSELVKNAYGDLFSLHGDKAMVSGAMGSPYRILSGRQTKRASIVGSRRATTTFQTLAGFGRARRN